MLGRNKKQSGLLTNNENNRGYYQLSKPDPISHQKKVIFHTSFQTWPGLLEAWLVLTSVKYHGNLYILIPLNQRLALTRLRATGPWPLTNYVVISQIRTRTKSISNSLTILSFRFHLEQTILQLWATVSIPAFG